MSFLVKICLQTIILALALILANSQNDDENNLLDSYLPASMQALAYYTDLLQYEPVETTTIEPIFFTDDKLDEKTTTSSPATTSTTTKRRTSTSTTTPRTTTASLSLTTKKPISSWFQSPSWWSSTTTTVRPIPTRKHKPGLYAPYPADLINSKYNSDENSKFEVFPFASDADFIKWLRKQSPRQEIIEKDDIHNNDLDLLPLSLTKDIDEENDDQINLPEVENLDNFLRNYDDKYGKFSPRDSITGKKRIPPTKAYVEFLLIYDLLKRDAKAANLSKYVGYTPKMLEELHELSSASAQRQLYTILKRLLDRNEIQRSDVVTRVKNVVKDLGNGNSVISKSMLYFPPLQFIP